MHSFLYLITFIDVLAKVPALPCRLGCVPYDRAFGALLVHSLFITKKFDYKEKKRLPQESNLHPLTCELDAQPTQHSGHALSRVRNVVDGEQLGLRAKSF